MTDDAPKPDALAPTGPDPAGTSEPEERIAIRKAQHEQREADRQARAAETRRQREESLAKARADREARNPAADAAIAPLVPVARATCGCEACGRQTRHTPVGRVVSGSTGRPGSCVAGVVLAELIARSRQP